MCSVDYHSRLEVIIHVIFLGVIIGVRIVESDSVIGSLK